MMKPLPTQQTLAMDSDATAADLANDLAAVKCPLGCLERPRFQGKRNRRLRFECSMCRLVFETTPKPIARPEITENATPVSTDRRNAHYGKRVATIDLGIDSPALAEQGGKPA